MKACEEFGRQWNLTQRLLIIVEKVKPIGEKELKPELIDNQSAFVGEFQVVSKANTLTNNEAQK